MHNNEGKTIAAIATAYGEGGIGIIRLSGDLSLEILKSIFSADKNKKKEKKFDNKYLHYGYILNPENGRIVDEVLATYMKAPNTYTREDVVEIYCHGSIVSLKKILELVLNRGAVSAEAGEFTKRAFLNGRIDLAQAEAVIDVIKAKTDKSFDVAVQQMEGSVSNEVHRIREDILSIVAEIVVDIDYPDEDATHVKNLHLTERITSIGKDIDNLISTADTGKMIREGLSIVIAGKPNVGKSSLMNRLLKQSRAIVTEIPGTTRDTIEEYMSIEGIPIKITDTAGIRETENEIEKIGIQRTKQAFNDADLVVVMLDGAAGLNDEDLEIVKKANDKKTLIIVNKIDLGNIIDESKLKAEIPHSTLIYMSALNGEGISLLEKEISQMVFSGKLKQQDSLLVTNTRHKSLLINALKEINESLKMLDMDEALDFIHVNLNQALEFLGEITGESVTEDILDKVFSEFCVGK